jgi:hypothetical protein
MDALLPPAPEMSDQYAAQPKQKKAKRAGISVMHRAGLNLPSSRVRSLVQRDGLVKKRIGKVPIIYLTALVEYVMRYLIRVTKERTLTENARRMLHSHLYRAIEASPLLRALFKDVCLATAMVPNLSPQSLADVYRVMEPKISRKKRVVEDSDEPVVSPAVAVPVVEDQPKKKKARTGPAHTKKE